VYLVGSGPGNPDLLTVRAQQLLEEGDIIRHDKVPRPDILGDIDPERREDVGTRGHGDRTPQSDVNDRMVELTQEEKTVVRLKGGDPMVFGRGSEELTYLAEHGVSSEVVPGGHIAGGRPGRRRDSSDTPKPRLLCNLRHRP